MKKVSLLAIMAMLSACSVMPEKTVSGTYQGTLPCADCQKIEAKLVLNKDKTYQYNTVYFKRKEQHPFFEKGTYRWDEKKANVLHLQAVKGQNNDSLPDILLKVSDTYVELCDADGNVAKGATEYRLEKVSP